MWIKPISRLITKDSRRYLWTTSNRKWQSCLFASLLDILKNIWGSTLSQLASQSCIRRKRFSQYVTTIRKHPEFYRTIDLWEVRCGKSLCKTRITVLLVLRLSLTPNLIWVNKWQSSWAYFLSPLSYGMLYLINFYNNYNRFYQIKYLWV